MTPEFIVPEIFNGLPVTAFFTTKNYTGDPEDLKKQISAEAIYFPVQKHSGSTLIIDKEMEPIVADAVLTARKRLAIGVKTADCVPILLYDRKKEIVGAVHAGWRGTTQRIIIGAISEMLRSFESSPEDIVMAIGPSIRGTCYAVGNYVAEALTEATGEGSYIISSEGRLCADLPEANRLQALTAGILPQNIWMTDDCTHCMPEKYHSYRYSKGGPGRQYSVICMK